MKTFKALSLLLSYPRADWMDHLDDLQEVIVEEKLLSKQKLKGINELISRLKQKDMIDNQENYVATFDRGASHSLHLFEHIHGESRDRGQAMIDLIEMYNANGLDVGTSDLPDYLLARRHQQMGAEYTVTFDRKAAGAVRMMAMADFLAHA